MGQEGAEKRVKKLLSILTELKKEVGMKVNVYYKNNFLEEQNWQTEDKEEALKSASQEVADNLRFEIEEDFF